LTLDGLVSHPESHYQEETLTPMILWNYSPISLPFNFIDDGTNGKTSLWKNNSIALSTL
jgi:hypothetical protein